jgi:hypothetical protein
MRVSRIMLWVPAGLFVIVLLLALGTNGCKMAKFVPPAGKKELSCTTKIKVDPSEGVIKEHQAVYICDDANYNQVTWDPPSSVSSFTVQFTGECPFTSCANIAYGHATVTVAPQPQYQLKVYKYTITVNNGPAHDPHVVGGGG